MPTSKKPRKKYKPRIQIYPDLHEINLIFRPIVSIFESLLSGEIESVKGEPVFRDWQGNLCEVSPALEGWCDCFARIGAGESVDIKLPMTRKIAAKLKYGTPLSIDEVKEALNELGLCRSLISRTTRDKLKSYMKVEEIQIEFDKMGLTNQQ